MNLQKFPQCSLINLIKELFSLVSWVDLKLNSLGQENGRKIRGGRLFNPNRGVEMHSHLTRNLFSALILEEKEGSKP